MQQPEISNRARRLSTLPLGGVGVLSFIDDAQNCHILRLCELGLIPGAKVEISRKGSRGSPFVLRFNQLDLCVDAELVQHFWVERTLEEKL